MQNPQIQQNNVVEVNPQDVQIIANAKINEYVTGSPYDPKKIQEIERKPTRESSTLSHDNKLKISSINMQNNFNN